MYIRMHVCMYVCVCCVFVCIYVHDTENLTISEEFRGWSAWNDADFPHGCRGTSAGGPRNFCAEGHKSSVRIRFENGGNQKMNFVRNNAKESRNTPQGSFEISL